MPVIPVECGHMVCICMIFVHGLKLVFLRQIFNLTMSGIILDK